MQHDVRECAHRARRTAEDLCFSVVCANRAEKRKVLNAVSKKAKDQLAVRFVPPAVVGKWRARVDSMQAAVKHVLR